MKALKRVLSLSNSSYGLQSAGARSADNANLTTHAVNSFQSKSQEILQLERKLSLTVWICRVYQSNSHYCCWMWWQNEDGWCPHLLYHLTATTENPKQNVKITKNNWPDFHRTTLITSKRVNYLLSDRAYHVNNEYGRTAENMTGGSPLVLKTTRVLMGWRHAVRFSLIAVHFLHSRSLLWWHITCIK